MGLTDESLADTGIWSGVVTPSCEPTDSGQRSELVSVASTWATTQLAPIETRPCTDSALESVYTVSPGGSPANLGQQPPDAPSPTSDRRPRPASGHPLQRLCPCLLPNGLLIFTFSTSLFSQVHGDGRRAEYALEVKAPQVRPHPPTYSPHRPVPSFPCAYTSLTALTLSLSFLSCRRRLKTLEQPAHTPEESVLAWGLAKPDNRQRGTEEIKRWGAPAAASAAAMDVEAVEAATAAV